MFVRCVCGGDMSDALASWYYEDTSGTRQGPFTTSQMREWHVHGYFSASLAVARQYDRSPHGFTPLSQLWPQIENAFAVAPVDSSSTPDATFIGPPGPPRGWKRSRDEAEGGGTHRDHLAAPPIDLRTASLEELYTDRLGGADSSDAEACPPPPRRFEHYERLRGELVNILDGLELHCDVLTAGEQRHLLKFVQRLRELGASGRLRARTYSAPSKWRKGNGRVTVQLGCCYNVRAARGLNPRPSPGVSPRPSRSLHAIAL